MRNGGDNWIVDNKLGWDLYMFSTKCDYAFRKGIVDTLLAIGIDIDVIEEGIEKNANMWRDQHMNMAFDNEFYPIFNRISYRFLGDDLEYGHELKEPDPEFKENWLKYRKYQYYQEHKNLLICIVCQHLNAYDV